MRPQVKISPKLNVLPHAVGLRTEWGSGLRCQGEDAGCCTSLTPCGVGEGDCDIHDDCAVGLLCGTDNCPSGWDWDDDCCTYPQVVKECNGGRFVINIVYYFQFKILFSGTQWRSLYKNRLTSAYNPLCQREHNTYLPIVFWYNTALEENTCCKYDLYFGESCVIDVTHGSAIFMNVVRVFITPDLNSLSRPDTHKFTQSYEHCNSITTRRSAVRRITRARWTWNEFS